MLRRLMLATCLLVTAGAALAQTTWWGYWNSGMPMESAAACYGETVDCGVRLSVANSSLVDGSIHGVRFYISDKTVVQRAFAWVSLRQFDWNVSQPDMAVKEIAVEDLRDAVHDGCATEVMFDEPVGVLPSANRRATAYVGFTLVVGGSVTSPCHVLSAGSTADAQSNSCFVRWRAMENSYGPLAMQLLVSGSRIGENAVSVGTLAGPVVARSKSSVALPVTFCTDGYAEVSDIDCLVTVGGVPQTEQHIVLERPLGEMGMSFTQPLEMTMPAEASRMEYRVEVTRVNGRANESEAPMAIDTLTSLSQMPVKRTVMEELTGTWCPNCPRGLVGMQLLEERFADRFIGIAIHGGSSTEPMRLAGYDGSAFVAGVSRRMGGRPSCSIDRTIDCDPYGGLGSIYHFGADLVVENLLQVAAVADVGIEARYADDTHASVDIDVATTFRYDGADGHYALMLVLTADSVTGDGDDWLQVNTLVGKTDYDADLDRFVYGERYMHMAYDHVPIWVDGVESGIEGSIDNGRLEADVAQHFAATASLVGTIAHDPAQVNAIAMLIDTRTGIVVNAAKTRVVGASASVSAAVGPSSAVAGRYAIDGRRLGDNDAKGGVVIVRHDDGTVRKTVALRR